MKRKRAMRFKVSVDMASEVLQKQPEQEICRILHKIHDDIGKGRVLGTIVDFDGNQCGKWEFISSEQY